MELDDSIMAVFHAQLSELAGGDGPVIEVPEQELQAGVMDSNTTYRIAVIDQDELTSADEHSQTDSPVVTNESPLQNGGQGPPVSEGDRHRVTITDTGSEGDGIAKIGGYTVFVPGSQLDETLEIEIVKAQPNYAFAEPVDGAKADDIAI